MEDGDGDDEAAMNHVAKRARYNKNCVVVFNDADRMEFLTGFRKRKAKRRQVAQEQRVQKERQKRLQDRRERRAALQEAKGVAQSGAEGRKFDNDAALQGEGEDDSIHSEQFGVSGTMTYEDKETTTVVRVTTIEEEVEDVDIKKPSSSYGGSDSSKGGGRSAGGPNKSNSKKEKVKFKKPKKAKSEKRMRKLTRREKSVPRNLRSKRNKKK